MYIRVSLDPKEQTHAIVTEVDRSGGHHVNWNNGDIDKHQLLPSLNSACGDNDDMKVETLLEKRKAMRSV